jgi:DNA-directed RNA polymerase subunit beta
LKKTIYHKQKKDADDETRIVQEATKIKVSGFLNGETVTKAPGLKRGSKISSDDLKEMSLNDIFSIRTKKADVNTRLDESEKALKKVLNEIKERFNEKKIKDCKRP